MNTSGLASPGAMGSNFDRGKRGTGPGWRRVALLLAAPLALAFTGCPLTQPGVRPPGGSGGQDGKGAAFVAGVFEGTMRLGRMRVQVKKPANSDLFVAQLGADGSPRWLRSFGSVRAGTSVATAPYRDGFIVVGVFQGDLALDTAAQALKTAGRDGLFFTRFDATGRVATSRLLGEAQTFASPDLVMADGGTFRVDVNYYGGGASAGGQQFPEAPNGGAIRLEITPEGDAKVQPKIVDPTGQGGTGTGTGPRTRTGDPVGPAPLGPINRGKEGPQSGYMLASMFQPAKCNVCAASSALGAANCASCRDTLCGPPPLFLGAERGCCLSGWDGTCMVSGLEKCAPASRECLCSHGTCTGGEAMLFVCSPGTQRGQCTSVVSGADSFCNNTWWDGLCISRAQTDGGGCF